MNQDTLSTNHPAAPDAPLPTPTHALANRKRRERVSSDDPLSLANHDRSERVPSNEEPTPTLANRERRERVSSNDAPDPTDPTRPTGPRTPAGKSRASKNALKHGLRAAKPENAVPTGMRRTYDKFRAQYLDEYRPSGATESTLLDMVIQAAWQLYRIREMELFAPIELASPFANSSFGKSDRLARYRASYERMYHTNLNQLRQIQQERLLLAADRAAALPAHIPPGVRLQPIFKLLDNAAWRSKARLATYAAASASQKPTPINRPKDQKSPFIRP